MSFVRGERRKKSKLWFWPDAAAQPLLCLSLQSRPVHLRCNKDFEGKAVDEYGRKFSYKCPVPECPRSISKAKPVGFKEWAIHAGVTHHLVEKVMEEEAVKTPAMKEVLAEVARVCAEAGWCWTTYRCL